MTTVDFHTHLLSRDVKFNRIYDKVALKIFGKKFGIDLDTVFSDPYNSYTKALLSSVRNSDHVSKIVLFGVDSRISAKGDIVLHDDITVCARNEDVYKLYKENKDVIIPFFSVNPNRSNALQLIDGFVDIGFKGSKFLQNYWNVDTRNKQYEPYFRKLAEYNIPLIIHAGSESSIHSYKDCESLEMVKRPLDCGVTVVAAHMALSYEPLKIFKALSKDPKNFNEDYFKLLQLLKEYPNLYADISSILTPVRAKVLRHLSEQTDIHDKLLFGTDFPVPFSAMFTTHDLSIMKRWEISKDMNPFNRYTSSILEYFPEDNDIYTNYKSILVGE
jgi:predicted TIM-barrel fold metal-dependent hydrolase